MDTLSWIINVLPIIGWFLNINVKYRLYAMVIFTVATILAIVYFAITWQVPFLLRHIFYLVIDIVTLWHIIKKEK